MEKKGLLIIKSSVNLSPEQHDQVQQHLDPLGEKLGLSVMVVSDPMDATVYYDPTPMVEALKEATKALNAAADRLNITESMDTRDLSSQIETVALQPNARRGFDETGLPGARIPVAQPKGSAR